MTVVNPWSLVLPISRAEQIVETLVNAFREIADAPAPDVSFDDGETAISKRLTRHLQTLLPDTLVSGFWDFEVSTVKSDMSDSRRLDITYGTVVQDTHNVRFIFECKKLYGVTDTRAKQYRRRYLEEGVRRFVIGSYAPDQPVAFMIGYVDPKGVGAVKATTASMAQGNAVIELGLRAYDKGRFHEAPPRQFAKHAVMETHHLRSLPLRDITLYHLELGFPTEGKAKARKR